ncbi:hypothetical protein [Salipiger sp. PrR003]|uniref:hypothetical protein n=1 Tax=Salipiger sp. PrR003 TaxID=2706776 RepID=UPI0013D93676|nr:hypothetical protein [Salipiger sp. PrR003]NDV51534.1 hypothetical protein [Salipiger sp. PrR003]
MEVKLFQTVMEAPLMTTGVLNVYVKGGTLCIQRERAAGEREIVKYPLVNVSKYETWLEMEDVVRQDAETISEVHLLKSSEPLRFISVIAPEVTDDLYRVFEIMPRDEVKVTSFPLGNIFRIKER